MLFRRKRSDTHVPTPKHVAIDLEGIGHWAEEKHVTLQEAYARSFQVIRTLIGQQIKLNIPIMTFFVMSPSLRGTSQAAILFDAFAAFLREEAEIDRRAEHKIKTTILGKWYDLPENVVEAVRKTTEETREYDSFFTNFCLNYDGKEEIVDACKMIARQIRLEKIDPDSISREMLKENMYTSYFISPDIIIRNGKEHILNSFLLWDSVGARIHFTNKLFPEFTEDDFVRALVK